MDKLPHSSFSTGTLRPDERFDAWCEDISVMFDVKNPSCENGSPFHAELNAYNLGQSFFCGVNSSAAQYARPRKKILSDGLDGILLQLFIEGEVQFGSEKQITHARSGDIVVFDLSQPVDNYNSSFHHLTIMLPGEVVDATIPKIRRWHGRRSPAPVPQCSYCAVTCFQASNSHHILAPKPGGMWSLPPSRSLQPL